jgi:hypothetical protein
MMNSKGMRIYYDGEGAGGGEGSAVGTGSLLNGTGGAAGAGAGSGGNGAGTEGAGGAGAGASGAGEFKLPDNWDYRSVLPPELKESPSAKKYANIAELVRGFDNAQQFIGRPTERLVEIPPNADATVRASVLEKLGHPKNFADYKVNAPKDGGDLLKIDSPNFKALAELAHKNGVMPDQFQGMVDAFGSMVAKGQADMVAAEQQRVATNISNLKTELGEAFDATVANANLAVNKLGGDKAGADALRDSISNAGLGTDGPLLKALAKVGEMFAEDTGAGDKGEGFQKPMTPDAAKNEGQRLLQEALEVMSSNPTKARELNLKAQEYFARAEKKAR